MRRQRIRLYSLGAVLLSILAAPVAGRCQQVEYPLAVAVEKSGMKFFVADRNLPGVWLVEGGSRSLYFQGSKKFRTPLNAVRCLALDGNQRLLAGDSSTRQVFRFDDQAQPRPLATPIDEKTQLGPLGIPMGIATDRQGNLFVSDLEFHCIWKIPGAGGEPQKFIDMQAPTGLCIDSADNVWVVSRVEDPLRRISPDGQVEVVVPGRPFEFPHSVAVDAEGRAYVVDGYKKTVWRVVPGRPPEAWLTHERFVNPVDIKATSDGVVVVDPRAKALFLATWQGQVTVIDLD